MLTESIALHNGFQQHEIGLLINYDPLFQGLSDAEFTKALPFYSAFREVMFIGPGDCDFYQNFMRRQGVPSDVAEILCQSRGYGNKKNLALLAALLRGYDLVIFWDDDEYPVALLQQGWVETNIVGAHANALDAEVTSGFCTGYTSPVPPDVCARLSEETATLLGTALAVGSDVITSKSFHLSRDFFCIPHSIPETQEIPEKDGGKWISGGNLGVRLKGFVTGVLPPFYTPDASRGDDTIFSMRLQRSRVFLVPSGIFHDCFLHHGDLSLGSLPSRIVPAASVRNDSDVKRLARAVLGWLAYAPLVIRLREPGSYSKSISTMIRLLSEVEVKLFEEWPSLVRHFSGQPLSEVLSQRAADVELQYTRLCRAEDAWRALMARL